MFALSLMYVKRDHVLRKVLCMSPSVSHKRFIVKTLFTRLLSFLILEYLREGMMVSRLQHVMMQLIIISLQGISRKIVVCVLSCSKLTLFSLLCEERLKRCKQLSRSHGKKELKTLEENPVYTYTSICIDQNRRNWAISKSMQSIFFSVRLLLACEHSLLCSMYSYSYSDMQLEY